MISISRRSLLKAAARLGVGAGLSLLGLGGERSQAQQESEQPFFRESATTLTLGNQFYEVDFDKRNGAITRIFDKRGGGVVSEGSAHGSLWALLHTESQHWIGSGSFGDPRFQADWDGDATLAMSWTVQSQDVEAVVTVDVAVSEEPYIDLTARIDHRRGQSPDQFSFLHNLLFTRDNIRHVLLPYLGGVLLGRNFFSNGRGFWSKYPGWEMMADFLWLEATHGTLSVYTLFGTSRWWLAQVSLSRDQTGSIPEYSWHHWFQMALTPGQVEIMPTVRLLIGEGKESALSSYRTHNGIDTLTSVADKAGDLYDTIVRSPISAQGIEEGAPPPWTAPVLLHPIGFQEQDWEYHNPDWWPPAERRGGTSAYRTVFGTAQRDGSLIMPYVNPTAGHEQSLTAGQLREEGLSLDDIAVRDRRGDPLRQEHGYSTGAELLHPVEIVRLSPSHPWYVRRLEEIMGPNTEARNDLVYFDQVGALWWYYDAQPTAPSPLEWSRAWLAHMERFKSTGPVVEGIWDRLTASAVIGTYSALYFDVVAPEGYWISDIETYFPVAAALFRDKTLQYAHNLEGITGWRWSAFEKQLETIDVFRWHVMMGQSLSIDPEHLRGSSEWGAVVSDFSLFVLGPYADDLLESFEGSSHAIALSRFASHTVVANATNEPHTYEEHTIAPRGVGFFAHDKSVTGGVFQSYNGRTLAESEHYLIEQRKPTGVVMRQPMGVNTRVMIRALQGWLEGSAVRCEAFNRSDDLVRAIEGEVVDSMIEFDYERLAMTVDDHRVIEGTIRFAQTNREDGLVEIMLEGNTTEPTLRQGRLGRREVERNSVDDIGFVAIAVTRDLVSGVRTADFRIEVEWYDGGGIESSVHQWLILIYYDGDVSGRIAGAHRARNSKEWRKTMFRIPETAFGRRLWGSSDLILAVPGGVVLSSVTVTNADELERRTVAYYTIHDPTQGETLTQGLHLRGWTDATQPIADLDLAGLAAIYAWDAEEDRWRMHSPHVPAAANTLEQLEQGRAYYVRVANGQTLHWPEAPYGGVGFHLQPGRNLVCWLGTPDKPLTDAIAPLRGMKAEPLVSVQIDDKTYDMEESRQATEPLPYGQALWVEIDAVGPTRWLQF